MKERGGKKRTYRYHTFGVVVQIFQQHLTQRKHLAPTTRSPRLIFIVIIPHPHPIFLTRHKASLLFQPAQQPPDLAHHLPVRNPIGEPLLDHNRPVEDEFIPAVAPLADAHRVPDDAVVVHAEGEQTVAELLRGDEIGRRRVEGEERVAQRGEGGRGCYAALGDLVQDA